MKIHSKDEHVSIEFDRNHLIRHILKHIADCDTCKAVILSHLHLEGKVNLDDL